MKMSRRTTVVTSCYSTEAALLLPLVNNVENIDELEPRPMEWRSAGTVCVFLSLLGVDGSCAKHENYTVVMLLTFILIFISIPSPPHPFIPGLKLSFSANPFHRSLPFLFQD